MRDMLNEINTVFLPTDFSENVREALPFAAEIALRAKARLTLLHCVEENIHFTPQKEERKEKIIIETTEAFDKLIGLLEADDSSRELQINTKLVSGHPKVNILEEIKAEPESLIVMGTKGASRTRKLLFGSLTTETILDSPVPVLAIPKGSTYTDFNQIVFATDYSRDDLEKVRETVEFARLFDASIRIVHMARFDNMETDLRFTGFKELVLREHPDMEIAFDLIYEADFFAGIADYLRTHAVDLLTMVRYKKSFWESMTTRNYSKKLGFYTKVPLMVLMSKSED